MNNNDPLTYTLYGLQKNTIPTATEIVTQGRQVALGAVVMVENDVKTVRLQ